MGVNKNTVKKFGAVSNETSLAMAKGLYKISKSNLIVSITGVAGPNGGTKKNPVGTVYFTFGVRQNKKTITYSTFRHNFKSKNRVRIQKKSVNYVLDKFIEIARTYKLD